MKCTIQWIDLRTGKPTPDDNEAVAMAVCHDPRTFGEKGSDPLPICAHHARRIADEEVVFWRLLPLPGVEPHEVVTRQIPMPVFETIVRYYGQDAGPILKRLEYDALCKVYHFMLGSLLVGVEPDGHMHT